MKTFLLFCLIPFFSLSAPAQKIKVGSSPVISSAGIYLAVEQGFFKEQGLEVEVTDIPSSSAPITALVAKGELDVGAGNLTSGMFNAMSSGKSFKLVADKGHIENGKDYIGLIVRKDHVDTGRFKTLKDLKGFKLGLTALDGVSQQVVASRLLKSAGLSDSDVEYVKLSYAEMNIALKTKSIDATIQLEPYLTKALLDGIAVKVASAADVHPKQQSAVLFYSPQFMAQKEKATRFLAAYIKGVRLYNQSLKDPKIRNQVVTSLKKSIKIEDPAVWEKMIPIGLEDSGKINLQALNEDIAWYKEKGYLKSADLTAEKVVDSSFSEQANQLLDTSPKGKK